MTAPTELVQLRQIMERTEGKRRIVVGLIDGPVALNHPDLAGANIREIQGKAKGACTRSDTLACGHGTFVAGILCARRGSGAPAICPGCTLLLRPIFDDSIDSNGHGRNAKPEELAEAVIESVCMGAHVINLSAALLWPSLKSEQRIQEALNYAARRGTLIVAAAGNQGAVGSSAITRHPWVIPVAACDLRGRLLDESNLGNSIGRRGLTAPGQAIVSLGTSAGARTFSGTSAAAPFVTGAIALLLSEFVDADPADVKLAVSNAGIGKRGSIGPPLLNAWMAYQILASGRKVRSAA